MSPGVLTRRQPRAQCEAAAGLNEPGIAFRDAYRNARGDKDPLTRQYVHAGGRVEVKASIAVVRVARKWK